MKYSARLASILNSDALCLCCFLFVFVIGCWLLRVGLHIYVEGKFRWKCINPFWQVAKLILSMGMFIASSMWLYKWFIQFIDISSGLSFFVIFFSFLFQSNKAIHFELICRVLTVDLTNKFQTLIVKWLVLFRQFTGDE
jgi:hypothetical protein